MKTMSRIDYLFKKHTESLSLEEWREVRTEEYFWSEGYNAYSNKPTIEPTSRTERLRSILSYKGYDSEQIYKILSGRQVSGVSITPNAKSLVLTPYTSNRLYNANLLFSNNKRLVKEMTQDSVSVNINDKQFKSRIENGYGICITNNKKDIEANNKAFEFEVPFGFVLDSDQGLDIIITINSAFKVQFVINSNITHDIINEFSVSEGLNHLITDSLHKALDRNQSVGSESILKQAV